MTADPVVDERACRVSLDVFDGPLDLLLSLVKERQLDIATLRLSVVADQYFAYISAMEAVDVEMAAEYLVIASTLVFLKSKALLPPIPVEFESTEESAEAVEARLRERLLVYSKYREAGDDLRERQAEAERVLRARRGRRSDDRARAALQDRRCEAGARARSRAPHRAP